MKVMNASLLRRLIFHPKTLLDNACQKLTPWRLLSISKTHTNHCNDLMKRQRKMRQLSSSHGDQEVHFSNDLSTTNEVSERKLQQMFDETNKVLHNTDLGSMQSREIYATRQLIFSFATHNTVEKAEIAEQLLERLIAEVTEGRNQSVPFFDLTKYYNAIIQAYAKTKTSDGADKAQALFKRMIERHELSSDQRGAEFVISAKPNILTYNCLLNAWCNSQREDAVSKAEEILSFLESGKISLDPDGATYNIMMNAYANQIGEYGYAQKAEDTLLLMTALQKEGKAIHPDTVSFNIVLKAWKNSGGGIENAIRAEEILMMMVKLYADGHTNVKPDLISFTTVLHAYTERGENGFTSEIIDRLENVVNSMLNSAAGLTIEDHNVSKTLNKVIECVGESEVNDAGDRAKKILDVMISSAHSVSTNINPSAVAYTNVIRAYFSNKSTVHKAEDMLKEFVDGLLPVLPTTVCLNTLLHKHCKNNDFGSAEKLLQKMKSAAKQKGYNTLPDVVTYKMMADLYFRSKQSDSEKKILSILQELEEAFDAGVVSELDPFVYNVVISKLLKSNNAETRCEAYNVLMRMVDRFDIGSLKIEPNTRTYNMFLYAFSREYTTEAADKAMYLLRFMENRNSTSSSPDKKSYFSTLLAVTRAMSESSPKRIMDIIDKLEKGSSNLQTNYSQVIEVALQGLAHKDFGDSGLAKNLLNVIHRLQKCGHNVEITPKSLDLVIKAHCHSDKPPGKQMPAFGAHEYLMGLVENFEKGETHVLPTRAGFNTLLNRWGWTKHWKCYLKAEELYSTMQRLSEEGAMDVSPDVFTNEFMLRIYFNNPHPKSTRRAITFFNSLDTSGLKTKSCNQMIAIFARSKNSKKIDRIRELLGYMQERGVANVNSYHNVIMACAGSKAQNALSSALQTYRETLTNERPNEMTIVLMTRACNTLSTDQDEKELILKSLFSDACDLGLLGDKVLNELEHGLSKEQIRRLTEQFRNSWKRNIKNKTVRAAAWKFVRIKETQVSQKLGKQLMKITNETIARQRFSNHRMAHSHLAPRIYD